MHKPTIKFAIFRAFGRINNALSTSIIAVENSAKTELVKMGCKEEKICTIVNGASPIRPFREDEKAFYRAKYGLKKDDFIISYFARLEDYKGHKTLLDAIKICQNSYQNFKFFIVGGGSQQANLKAYAKKLKIENSLNFLGFLEDVTPIFNITDLNLNCSYLSETASLSISEGFSLGIPCVASNIGGNPYMLKNQNCGILFEAQNPNSLAQAICKLYTDKKLYKNCSLCASIRYAEELNDKIMTKKLENLYSKANQKES
jgi:glycosyltransferase involved in cell wall biosynthesis